MAVLLEDLLPRIYPDLRFLCISHQGKQDLEKSIPRKLRAWQEPGVRFVIVRDKDEGDCRRVKAALYSLCQAGRREDSLIRIACHELEAWYLGDTEALATAFGNESLRGLSRKAGFAILTPSHGHRTRSVRWCRGFKGFRGRASWPSIWRAMATARVVTKCYWKALRRSAAVRR